MSDQLANIHDAFFKQVLSDPMLAATFLQEQLPPEVATLLGPELPDPVPGSFVDEELRQHHSDLLFRVRLRSGGDALAYVLIEHKSSPDPGARIQLLRYVVRMLTHHYDQNDRQLPLPPVLPLLVNQGPESWTASCEFSDLFGPAPQSLRPYLPYFQHALVDLTTLDDRELSADVRLRAFLKALKYRRRPDLDAWVAIILADAPGLLDQDLAAIVIYLVTGPTSLSDTAVTKTLDRLVPERKEMILGPLTRPYYEKGLAEGEAIGEARGEVRGEARGEARGETRGKAKLLAKLLQRRFGEIPAAVQQRIFAADAGSIEAWAERAFVAPNLQAVFEPN